jgi:hypothetical protein
MDVDKLTLTPLAFAETPDEAGTSATFDAAAWLPRGVGQIRNHHTDLPRIAKDAILTKEIERCLPLIPTRHDFYNADARQLAFIAPESVHLVVTSPPYWTLKKYQHHPDQLGGVSDYAAFLDALDQVWRGCYRALVPGGRLVCVVGDVCLSRRKNGGVHTVVPLHASIQERCRNIGYFNLAPIIWHNGRRGTERTRTHRRSAATTHSQSRPQNP